MLDPSIAAHHAFLRRALPAVQGLALKVARVHGAHDPRLWELEDVVRELGEILGPRLDGDEAAAELAALAEDHDVVGALLDRARAVTEGFHVPDWGCASYRALGAQLAALDDDLQRCLRLERELLG